MPTVFASSPTPVLFFILLGLLPLFFPGVSALSSTEEWADFSDNLVTDLAPLLTLFGEQVTKQCLSESVGFLDSVIFALAPLGILTAVVSAIRLYGHASLKSFIGRAQEAHGVAEAEMCSSTSEDVCELWSNGGICRVFGRPKMLEFMYTKARGCYQDGFDPQDGEPPHCGIYPVKAVLCETTADRSSERWIETRKRARFSHEFAPFPNLSLNVGTRRTSTKVLLGAAALGLLLEGSFFGYATWATFYNPGFYADDSQSAPTVVLCPRHGRNRLFNARYGHVCPPRRAALRHAALQADGRTLQRGTAHFLAAMRRPEGGRPAVPCLCLF